MSFEKPNHIDRFSNLVALQYVQDHSLDLLVAITTGDVDESVVEGSRQFRPFNQFMSDFALSLDDPNAKTHPDTETKLAASQRLDLWMQTLYTGYCFNRYHDLAALTSVNKTVFAPLLASQEDRPCLASIVALTRLSSLPECNQSQRKAYLEELEVIYQSNELTHEMTHIGNDMRTSLCEFDASKVYLPVHDVDSTARVFYKDEATKRNSNTLTP
ncbi:hypothetical protein AB6D11_00600 [Vibrio splendidus]